MLYATLISHKSDYTECLSACTIYKTVQTLIVADNDWISEAAKARPLEVRVCEEESEEPPRVPNPLVSDGLAAGRSS